MNGFQVLGFVVTVLALIQLGCWLVPATLVRSHPQRYPGPGWLFHAKPPPRRLPRTCPRCQRRDTIEYGLLILKQWYRLTAGSGWKNEYAVTYLKAGRLYRCTSCLAVFQDAEDVCEQTEGLHPLIRQSLQDEPDADARV